jgi:hypothetical protein
MSILSNKLATIALLLILSSTLIYSNSYATSYGEILPCQEYTNPTKKQMCLEKTKKRLEKQLNSARKDGDVEQYTDVLEKLNTTYWEFWNVCTHWWS